MLHFTPKRHRLRAAVIQPRGIATVSTDRCLSGAARQLPNRCKINSRRTGAKLTHQRLTLLSARRLLLGHKPQGKVEQKASMVPYQEVQGTSQTPCVGSRAGSQPGSSNAPPAGLIWSHRLDAAAAAGAEPSLQDCPHTNMSHRAQGRSCFLRSPGKSQENCGLWSESQSECHTCFNHYNWSNNQSQGRLQLPYQFFYFVYFNVCYWLGKKKNQPRVSYMVVHIPPKTVQNLHHEIKKYCRLFDSGFIFYLILLIKKERMKKQKLIWDMLEKLIN